MAVEGQFPRGFGVQGTGGTPMGQATLTPNTKKEEDGFGVIRALDPKTLDKKWEYKMSDITWGGVLTTASDLLFSGGKEGYFFALDARNGELLWKMALGGQINSGPMSYSANGRQYVTVAAGNSLFAFALRQSSVATTSPCLPAPIQSRQPILSDVPPWRCGLNRGCAIQSRITC
jgi:outer membrane protein assembly factor BamB